MSWEGFCSHNWSQQERESWSINNVCQVQGRWRWCMPAVYLIAMNWFPILVLSYQFYLQSDKSRKAFSYPKMRSELARISISFISGCQHINMMRNGGMGRGGEGFITKMLLEHILSWHCFLIQIEHEFSLTTWTVSRDLSLQFLCMWLGDHPQGHHSVSYLGGSHGNTTAAPLLWTQCPLNALGPGRLSDLQWSY